MATEDRIIVGGRDVECVWITPAGRQALQEWRDRQQADEAQLRWVVTPKGYRKLRRLRQSAESQSES
jgi:hypothetical protein